MTTKTGIELALAKFDNSPRLLARALGGSVVRQHIEHWLKTGKVPAERALDMTLVTGVPLEALCPDANWSAVTKNTPAQLSAN